MASRDTLFTPWPKYLIRARAHGTLEGEVRVRQFSILCFVHMCICVLRMCVCVWLYTCFQQSRQPLSVLLAGVLMYHWGSFETVSQVHWVRGGALQCTATLGRNGPCGRQPGAYDQSGAAQYLQGRANKKRKSVWTKDEIRGKVQIANLKEEYV